MVFAQDSTCCPFVQPPSKLAEAEHVVLELPHAAPAPLHAVEQFLSEQVPKGRAALVHAGSFAFSLQAEDALAEQLRLPPEQMQDR